MTVRFAWLSSRRSRSQMPKRTPSQYAGIGVAGWRRVAGIGRELAGAIRETADIRSQLRLTADIVLYRALRLWPGLGAQARHRQVQVGGATLTYRLNRGDIQGIREVWLDQIYRMPPPHAFRIVVDLGTNIGLTAVWLQREYGAELVLGVEPDPQNVALARENMKANGVEGRVIHAAIGAEDGEARFSSAKGASNLGRVGTSGATVRQISMGTVLAELPAERRVDLMKLDVEGGEQDLLLAENLAWLCRVDVIVAEFHPDRVDTEPLISRLEQHGFDYFPAGTLWAGSMDIFRRTNAR